MEKSDTAIRRKYRWKSFIQVDGNNDKYPTVEICKK